MIGEFRFAIAQRLFRLLLVAVRFVRVCLWPWRPYEYFGCEFLVKKCANVSFPKQPPSTRQPVPAEVISNTTADVPHGPKDPFLRRQRLEQLSAKKGVICTCGRAKPTFGWPDDTQPLWCARCRAKGVVKLRGPTCRCGRAKPLFGMPSDANPACCSKCKEEGMLNIRSEKCKCGRAQPSFGFANEPGRACCSKCKVEGMVDKKNPKCRCGKARPCFGLALDTRPSCCSQCKDAGMIDICSPRCKMCNKHAHYPDEAGRRRQFCAKHSAEVGAHALFQPGRSRIASQFFDALEKEIRAEFPFRHRFDAETATWSGREFAGLVADRNLQPDAYDPVARKVVEFLGNFYHGFPPEHPQ